MLQTYGSWVCPLTIRSMAGLSPFAIGMIAEVGASP
jgi:hypothetical protein